MSKKELMFQIDLMGGMAAAMLRLASRCPDIPFGAECRASADAINLCAGNLARAIGIGSMIWDKPVEMKVAA